MRRGPKLLACRLLMLALIAGAAPAVAQSSAARAPASRESPAVQTLMSTSVGAQPHADMHWPQVLEVLGLADEATLLRSPLLDNWLREAAGSPLLPPRSIGEVLVAEAARSTRGLDSEAQARWALAFGQHLQVRMPTAAVPMPDEIQTMRAQLVESAPGLWTLSGREGAVRGLFARVELVNNWNRPFPATEFELRAARTTRSPPLVFGCLPPQGLQPRAIASGEAARFLCRLKDAAAAGPDLAQAGVWLPQAASGGMWLHKPAMLATDTQRSQVVRALADTPTPVSFAWLNRHAMTCAQRGDCPPKTEVPKATQADTALSNTPKKTFWQHLVTVGAVAAGLLAYIVVARWAGPWIASAVLGLIGLSMTVPMALSLLRQNTADQWGGFLLIPIALLLLVVPVVVAMLAAKVYITAARLIDEPGYRVTFLWAVCAALASLALTLLIGLMQRG